MFMFVFGVRYLLYAFFILFTLNYKFLKFRLSGKKPPNGSGQKTSLGGEKKQGHDNLFNFRAP